MYRNKKNSGSDSGQIAAIASGLAVLQGSLTENTSPEQFCDELTKVFDVQITEIALLRLESGCLKFIFPKQLKTAGSIPASSSSSIVAHTAVSKKAELHNNFSKVKHASVFETVKLGSAEDHAALAGPPIQKLMSAPVLDDSGNVMGVLQLCRKGQTPASAGPDFNLEQLHQLERAARIIAQASFMKKHAAASSGS